MFMTVYALSRCDCIGFPFFLFLSVVFVCRARVCFIYRPSCSCMSYLCVRFFTLYRCMRRAKAKPFERPFKKRQHSSSSNNSDTQVHRLCAPCENSKWWINIGWVIISSPIRWTHVQWQLFVLYFRSLHSLIVNCVYFMYIYSWQ